MNTWPEPPARSVYGVLLNFRGALAALGNAIHEPPYLKPPVAPILYIKPPNSWTIGGRPIQLPAGEAAFEVGATVGIVVARETLRVRKAAALDHVAGLTVVNDLCLPHASFYRPAIKERCRDASCAIGTGIVALTSAGDLDGLSIRTYVNGVLRQQGNTRDLIRSISQLIADVSEFMTLARGDLLMVGVPERSPLVSRGDIVRVDVEGIGSLENPIVTTLSPASAEVVT